MAKMPMRFGAIAPTPIPEPIIIPPTKSGEAQILNEIQRLEIEDAIVDQTLGLMKPAINHISAEELDSEREDKLSKLVSDDFPFDESQILAINGLASQKYACMTGAAGTGKTTCTKAAVQKIQESGGLGEVDMSNYFKRGIADNPEDEADDYEVPEKLIPSVVVVTFTGRASQEVKENFPRDWHGNIMTIHRCLAYMPEYYEDFDPESNDLKTKMRFVPTFDADNLMPWDHIVIDEAGMLGLDLWHNLFAAMKPGCRVTMIGDINQLPPVHGRSIFGFAMAKWPTWELTHVHRQKGKNNSIVENAWRILKGERPKSDTKSQRLGITTEAQFVETVNALLKDTTTLDDGTESPWKFVMIEVPEDHRMASKRIRQLLQVMKTKNLYDPILDAVITATNGHDGSKGELLGQIPLNRELAIAFNRDHPRYVIDASRERKYFAVGDKVMATRNDHEAGITNGMTGVIESIEVNMGYAGDALRWGLISEVSKYLADIGDTEDDGSTFTLEELAETHEAQEAAATAGKEKKDRGPASHIVTVRFGAGEHSFTLPFGSLAEVASLQTAYVVTCHKMQGGQAPLVQTIVHQAHRQMLYREWAYTAVTRSRERHVLMYTKIGLSSALSKQKIAGKTLKEKIQNFQALQKVGLVGAAIRVNLQEPESIDGSPVIFPQNTGNQVTGPVIGSLAELAARKLNPTSPPTSAQPPETPTPEPLRERVIIIERQAPTARTVVDGGELIREQQKADALRQIERTFKLAQARTLPPPMVPTHTPEQLYELAQAHARTYHRPLLLTHKPEVKPAVAQFKLGNYRSLGALLKKGQ